MDRIVSAGHINPLVGGFLKDAGTNPPTVYANVMELAEGIRSMRPASRTSAEAINIILSGMDPEARQRTLRALVEVYEMQTA